jgi:hypothetical protein
VIQNLVILSLYANDIIINKTGKMSSLEQTQIPKDVLYVKFCPHMFLMFSREYLIKADNIMRCPDIIMHAQMTTGMSSCPTSRLCTSIKFILPITGN